MTLAHWPELVAGPMACSYILAELTSVSANISQAKVSTKHTSVFSYGLYFQTGQISDSEDAYVMPSSQWGQESFH